MLSRSVSKWLGAINQTEDFLEPKLNQLSDQTLIKDRDVVIDRIALAISRGESIVIFGDYDVDGSSATIILTEAIRSLGGRVTPLLASRFGGGGYGLSDVACDKILSHKPQLVISCDCGGSDGPRIERLNAVGIDCLVIDHHVVPKEKHPALGFLNPHRPDCPSDERAKGMCSGGLAFSVVGGLKKKLQAEHILLNDYLDLVAMSTVADVAPLTGDNRPLTRAGLKLLVNPSRPGLRALYDITNFSPTEMLTGRDIGFRVAPAINAPGRLGDPDIILDLLMEKDPERARAIAQQVVDLWHKRRLDTETITEEAIRHVDATNQHLSTSIVVGHEEWNHGIVGIVAARLVEKYHVPVACIGSEGRGSLRGPAGSTLYDALCYCKDTLVKYGGHQAAAGCQVDWGRLEDFRHMFREFFIRNPITKPDTESRNILPIDPSDDILSVANDISRLEPCGQGNPRPIVTITCQVKAAKAVKGNHLKLDLILTNGQPLSGFYLNQGDLENSLKFGQFVAISGDLKRSTWNGRVKAEIFVSTLSVT